MIKRTPQRQRGTVLVTVLMMFAIAAFLATEMAYRQRLDVRRTGAMLLMEQAREYLLSAEELAKLALRDDFQSDKRSDKFVDSLGEQWALKRPPFPVEGGFIQGEVLDAQGRFNINSLVDATTGKAGSAASKLAQARFVALLNGLGIPEEGSPQQMYEKIVDWIDIDQDETGFDGREDNYYAGLPRPYRTANRFISDISELKYIDGIDIKTYNILEKYLSALPPGTPLNVNTAEPQVLEAMGLSDVDKWVAERDDNPAAKKEEFEAYFPKLEDARKKYGITDLTDDVLRADLTYSSSYFELRARAGIGGREVFARSLLYRQPKMDKSEADGSVRMDGTLDVIYRAYVDPLHQQLTTAAVESQ